MAKIQDLKAKWVDHTVVNATKQYVTIAEKPEARRKREADYLDDIMHKYIELYPKEWLKYNAIEDRFDNLTAVRAVRQVITVDNKVVCGRYKQRDFVDALHARISPDSWENRMVNFCEFKV